MTTLLFFGHDLHSWSHCMDTGTCTMVFIRRLQPRYITLRRTSQDCFHPREDPRKSSGWSHNTVMDCHPHPTMTPSQTSHLIILPRMRWLLCSHRTTHLGPLSMLRYAPMSLIACE
jgi:hypothetical protein